MKREQTYPARWYLSPTDAKTNVQPVSGTYMVTEAGEARARLFEPFPDRELPFIIEDNDVPTTIYGNVFGSAVTLDGCRLGNWFSNSSDMQDLDLHTNVAYEGLWLGQDEVAFTCVRVQLWDQDEWTQWQLAEIKPREGPPYRLLPEAVRFNVPDPIAVVVGDATISLEDASSFGGASGHPRGLTYIPQSVLKLEFERPVPIEEVLAKYVMPLEFLIITSTGRRSGIRSFRGTNAEWRNADGNELPSTDRWVKVRKAHGARPDSELHSHRLLHKLSDFDLSRQLPLVMHAVSENRYAVEHFAALASSSGFPLGDFMSRCQLVEAFDRSLHSSENPRSRRGFDSRLGRLEVESGNVVDSVVGSKTWRWELGELRNIVAHGFKTAADLTADLRSVQVGAEMLRLLFEARFLVAIGFSAEKASELVKGRSDFWQWEKYIKDNYQHLRSMARGS